MCAISSTAQAVGMHQTVPAANALWAYSSTVMATLLLDAQAALNVLNGKEPFSCCRVIDADLALTDGDDNERMGPPYSFDRQHADQRNWITASLDYRA